MIAVEKSRMTLDEFRALPETNAPTKLIGSELILAPAPCSEHQDIAQSTTNMLKSAASSGRTHFAPLDVHLGEDVTQPDVLWVSGEGSACHLGEDGWWHGAREYWIVGPAVRAIYAYARHESQFVEVCIFTQMQTFHSPLLGLEIRAAELFG